MRQRSKHELRCFCRTEPLLAVYGLLDDGRVYIHVKIFKQSRIYGETFYVGGTIRLRCRECLRWHQVRLLEPNKAILEETSDPLPPEQFPAPRMLDPR